MKTNPQLALRVGRSRALVAVDSIKAASAAWCRFRDENDLGSSKSPKVTVVDTTLGRQVASISYNGRAWDNNDKEIV